MLCMQPYKKLILLLSFVFISKYFVPPNVSAQTVAAGGRHSLLICADSTVQAWGYNGYGQLGNSNTTEQHSGVKVTGMNGIVSVSGGLFHSIFIKENGTVWTCGRNNAGPLGDGSTLDRHTPVQVIGLSNIIQASGGGEHSLFLGKDQTVWSCGLNSSGQLGDGSSTNRLFPIQISGLTNVIQVAAGAEFSLFLKEDGSVWACGHNGFGQFGNGTNASNKNPIQINGLSDIIQITAGEWHALFVKKDGTVYSSGRNQFGQLGNGTQTDQWLASPINDLSEVIKAEAGGIHSVFVTNTGTVYACGLNSGGNNDGQLGDGTAIDRTKPVLVNTSWGTDKIIHAEACREHTLFLSEKGPIWASGRNNYGQLGIGYFTTANFKSPIQSNTLCVPILVKQYQPEAIQITYQLFPNPTSGSITLKSKSKLKKASISLYNSCGILSRQTNYNQENEFHFDLKELKNGLYILTLSENNKFLYSDKIIINHE